MMIGYMVNNILPLRAGEIVRVYVVAAAGGEGSGRRWPLSWSSESWTASC